MANDDLVKCPFCGGFTHVAPDLVAALRDPNVRRQIEAYAAQLLHNESPELAPVDAGTRGAANTEGRDFNKDVHTWNPYVPVWRRSPKE